MLDGEEMFSEEKRKFKSLNNELSFLPGICLAQERVNMSKGKEWEKMRHSLIFPSPVLLSRK
jgi:hypothetical protein